METSDNFVHQLSSDAKKEQNIESHKNPENNIGYKSVENSTDTELENELVDALLESSMEQKSDNNSQKGLDSTPTLQKEGCNEMTSVDKNNQCGKEIPVSQ